MEELHFERRQLRESQELGLERDEQCIVMDDLACSGLRLKLHGV